MRWAGSGEGAAVFALTEAGGPLTDLGELTGSEPDRRCRAEIRVDTPAGPWTVRLASLISDAPAGLLWDTEGLLLVKYGFHVYAFEARTGDLRWAHRSASPLVVLVGLVAAAARRRPGGDRDLRAAARRRGRVARRPLGRGHGGRARRRPPRADELRRPGRGRSTRSRDAAPADAGRATGRTVDGDGWITSSRCGGPGWISALTPVRRGRSVEFSPKGPSDANGRDDIRVHASSRFLRVTDSPRTAPSGRRPRVCDHPGRDPPAPRRHRWARARRRLAAAARHGSRRPRRPDHRRHPRRPRGPGRGARAARRAPVRRRPGPRRLGRGRGRTRTTARSCSVAAASSCRSGRGWTAFEDIREVVPFEIGEGLDRIAVDGDALDEGLVVVTRESIGTARDLGDRVPDGTPPGRRHGSGSTSSAASITRWSSASRSWTRSGARCSGRASAGR